MTDETKAHRLNITLRPETVERIKAHRSNGYRVNVSAIVDEAINRGLDRLLGLEREGQR